MGLFDKLKGAVNAVTGGAAKVSIQVDGSVIFPGEPVKVFISATSTGAEIKSAGIYVDVKAAEEVSFKDDQTKAQVTRSHTSIEQTFQIAPAFVLAAGESKQFEGSFTLPGMVSPTFIGAIASHKCYLRGRMEAFGNDPDSGFQPVKVGSKT
jgi:sporulation-control protein spo0M